MVITETKTFLPEELADKMREFIDQGKTGKIILNLHEGRIKSWELSEMGRIHESCVDKPNNNTLR